jgi:hypothetical protein
MKNKKLKCRKRYSFKSYKSLKNFFKEVKKKISLGVKSFDTITATR